MADVDGTLVGFACAHDLGFRAYLSELAVLPTWQRKGVGTALVRAVTEVLAARGCDILVADVYPPAAAFYERLGWYKPDARLLACRTGAG